MDDSVEISNKNGWGNYTNTNNIKKEIVTIMDRIYDNWYNFDM